MQIGRIDERGYLKGFSRRGFTPAKCLSELIANSLDSMDKLPLNRDYKRAITFSIFSDTLRMIDNGYGMSSDDAERMFALHNENHSSDKSRGVSGVGAKPSISLLGNRQETNIYTRVTGGDYLRITVPWNRIHAEGVWTDMVTTRLMTEDEKECFKNERNTEHGTTIEFRKNDILCGILEESFQRRPSNPLDSPGIIFGRDDVIMVLSNYICPSLVNDAKLKLYNYFDRSAKFYTGIQEDTIEQYYSPQDGRDRYIWKDGDDMWEVPYISYGRYSKDMKKLTVGLSGYHKVGEYVLLTGLREDKNLFDPENPKDPSLKREEGGIGGSNYIGSYNEEHLGEDSSGFLSCFKLGRNGQLVGLIEPADICMSSARANWASNLETSIVQAEVRFNPYSSQEDNHQDRAMNIQENKNQFDGKSLPKNFTRLLRALKKKKVQQIQEYITMILESVKSPQSPPSAPPPSPPSAPPPSPSLLPEEENTIVLGTPMDSHSESTSSAELESEEEAPVTPQPSIQAPLTGRILKEQLARLAIILGDEMVYDSPEFIQLSKTLMNLLASAV